MCKRCGCLCWFMCTQATMYNFTQKIDFIRQNKGLHKVPSPRRRRRSFRDDEVVDTTEEADSSSDDKLDFDFLLIPLRIAVTARLNIFLCAEQVHER